MSIIESVVMGLKYYKELGHPHEAVCPSNILISQDGFIMLSDPWFNVDENRMSSGDRVYMSPERLQSYNMSRTNRVDWYTADLWSLAIVII
jgi:serine/threonine protein kinase